MRSTRLRSLIFQLHRYLGLICGLILVVIGTTGSLLVFSSEIEHQLVISKIGVVIPQENLANIDRILATVRTELRQMPGFTLGNLLFPQDAMLLPPTKQDCGMIAIASFKCLLIPTPDR